MNILRQFYKDNDGFIIINDILENENVNIINDYIKKNNIKLSDNKKISKKIKYKIDEVTILKNAITKENVKKAILKNRYIISSHDLF